MREFTDHDVHDPGVTLLRLVAYALPVVVIAAAAYLVRRSRRSVVSAAG